MQPTKPSECAAAVSLSEDGAPHPYASIFYTSHKGRITFFALAVNGTRKEGESTLVTFEGADTNPDEAPIVLQGTLENGGMSIATDNSEILLANMDEATTFVSLIRMLYSMEANGA